MRRKLKTELIVALVYAAVAIAIGFALNWRIGVAFFSVCEVAMICWRRYTK